MRTLRESGARLEAARAALDYAAAAQDGPSRTIPIARDMLASALETFQQGRLDAEAERARALLERFPILDPEQRDPVPGPA